VEAVKQLLEKNTGTGRGRKEDDGQSIRLSTAQRQALEKVIRPSSARLVAHLYNKNGVSRADSLTHSTGGSCGANFWFHINFIPSSNSSSIIFELMNDSIVSQGTKPNGTRNFHPKGQQTQFTAIFNSATQTARQQPNLKVKFKNFNFLITYF
jgi:hypothetical protein